MMDHLPIEVVGKYIFSCLNLDDLTACRSVCKEFKKIVDYYVRVKTLVISETRLAIYSRSFYDRKILACQPYLETKKIGLLKHGWMNSLLLNLKHLYLHEGYKPLYDWSSVVVDICEFLNSFQKLEKLELVRLHIRTNTTLHLPNLSSFHGSSLYGDQLTLNCFKLSKLKYYGQENSLTFKCTDRIDFCELDLYHGFVKSFINLRYLYCNRLNTLDNDLLKCLPELEEFHLNHDETAFNRLQEQKRLYRRENLTIYYRGVYFYTFLPAYTSYIYDGDDDHTLLTWSLYYDNLADQIPFIGRLDYNLIERNFTRLPSTDFIDKLIDLEWLSVVSLDSLNSQLEFIRFLKNCKHLSGIRFEQTHLSSDFFCKFLPKLFPFLRTLAIFEYGTMNEVKKFKFIFKFEYLTQLETCTPFPLDFVVKIFKNLKHFEHLHFNCYEMNAMKIQKFPQKFTITLNGDEEYDFKELEELQDLSSLDPLLSSR